MILLEANTDWRISVITNLKWENIKPEMRIIVDQNNKQMRSKGIKNRKVMVAYLQNSTWNYLKFIALKKKGFIFPDLQVLHPDTRSGYFTDKIIVSTYTPRAAPVPYLKDDKGGR